MSHFHESFDILNQSKVRLINGYLKHFWIKVMSNYFWLDHHHNKSCSTFGILFVHWWGIFKKTSCMLNIIDKVFVWLKQPKSFSKSQYFYFVIHISTLSLSVLSTKILSFINMTDCEVMRTFGSETGLWLDGIKKERFSSPPHWILS